MYDMFTVIFSARLCMQNFKLFKIMNYVLLNYLCKFFKSSRKSRYTPEYYSRKIYTNGYNIIICAYTPIYYNKYKRNVFV